MKLTELTEVLTRDELDFLNAVIRSPGCKLNGGEAFGEDGALWPRLEELGLIECVGSYKWKSTDKVILCAKM